MYIVYKYFLFYFYWYSSTYACYGIAYSIMVFYINIGYSFNVHEFFLNIKHKQTPDNAISHSFIP